MLRRETDAGETRRTVSSCGVVDLVDKTSHSRKRALWVSGSSVAPAYITGVVMKSSWMTLLKDWMWVAKLGLRGRIDARY